MFQEYWSQDVPQKDKREEAKEQRTVVVQEALDTSHSTDSHILIPQLPSCKVHDVLFANATDHSLNLLRVHSATCGDDLAAYVFGNSGGAVKRKQNRSLELGFGTLGLSFSHVV